MVVFEQVCGMGRIVSRFYKGNTEGIFIVTFAWCFLFIGTGSKDGETGCKVFSVYGRHLDISTYPMEIEKSNPGAQPDV